MKSVFFSKRNNFCPTNLFDKKIERVGTKSSLYLVIDLAREPTRPRSLVDFCGTLKRFLPQRYVALENAVCVGDHIQQKIQRSTSFMNDFFTVFLLGDTRK